MNFSFTFALFFLLMGTTANVFYMVGTPGILKGERVLISSLNDYVRTHEGKLEQLQNLSSNGAAQFGGIEELFEWDDADAIKSVFKRDSALPFEEEVLNTAVLNILLLHDVYKFPAASLAEGELAGAKYTRSFSGEECYEVASRGLDLLPYSGCLDFFEVAVRKGFATPITNTTRWLRDAKRLRLGDLKESPKRLFNEAASVERVVECCREEGINRGKSSGKLRCYFEDRGRAFLKLAPLKTEELSSDFEIYLFHRVLSERQCDELTRITPRTMTSNFRFSKIDSGKYRVTRETHAKASLVSGLNLEHSRKTTIKHYLVGGYTDLHYDSPEYPKSSGGKLRQLERTASLLFYLNDVKMGGATVFPYLNLTVYPERGSALFWFNLDAMGNRMEKSQHSTCPVILGDKWIQIYFINRTGQELIRPCGLKPEM